MASTSPATATWSRTSTPRIVGSPTEGSVAPLDTAVPMVSPAVPPSPIALNDAWNMKPKISTISIAVGQDRILSEITATPDARYLVCSVDSRRSNEQGRAEPGVLVLFDVQTRQITEIHRAPLRTTAIVTAAADDNWVVWAEAAQEPGFFSDWVLYAYNRASHSMKQIATAPTDKNGAPLVGAMIQVRADHGVAVWSQPTVTNQSSGAVTSEVHSIDLATGQTRLLTDNGLGPSLSWPYAAWTRAENQPSSQIQGANKGTIVVRNLVTGSEKALIKPDTPSNFALYKGTIVWITADEHEAVLTDVDETYQKTIARAAEDDRFEFPYIGERFVVWRSPVSTQAWDLAQQRLITLETKAVWGIFTVGNALVWMSPPSASTINPTDADLEPNDRTIHVLDSSQLPK